MGFLSETTTPRERDEVSAQDWRTQSRARAARRARRRARTILFLVALAVIVAASAAFVVPMLLTR